jgi:hypothetical protein
MGKENEKDDIYHERRDPEGGDGAECERSKDELFNQVYASWVQ